MISESTNDNLLKPALFSAHSAQKNSNHFRDNQLRQRDGTKDKVEDSSYFTEFLERVTTKSLERLWRYRFLVR
ncbi:MAG: hypothetical protein OSB05_06385 [Akkermansiaceae bacterium]|nr:hypothetical protein [Akkermansiaceae bacterium]